MFNLVWNNEVIERDIPTIKDAEYLQREYIMAYKGPVHIVVESSGDEMCPHCGHMNEVGEFKIYECSHCGGELLACSMCDYVRESASVCIDCPLKNNEDIKYEEA